MKNFLEELEGLLTKHDATILRSANSTHDLVASLCNVKGEFEEVCFEEEINNTSIRFEMYSEVK